LLQAGKGNSQFEMSENRVLTNYIIWLQLSKVVTETLKTFLWQDSSSFDFNLLLPSRFMSQMSAIRVLLSRADRPLTANSRRKRKSKTG
jgi:hypothetical protein